jgi:hypothetical protein
LTAKFDLSITLGEIDGQIKGWIEYNTDLFEPATIARLITHYETLARGTLRDSAQPFGRHQTFAGSGAPSDLASIQPGLFRFAGRAACSPTVRGERGPASRRDCRPIRRNPLDLRGTGATLELDWRIALIALGRWPGNLRRCLARPQRAHDRCPAGDLESGRSVCAARSQLSRQPLAIHH